MKRAVSYFFILSYFFLAGTIFFVSAQEITIKNIGFPTKNVWFSKENFLEGEEVSINTLVLNDAQGTFAGVMEFFDKDTLLGKTTFSVTVTQKVKIVSFSWIPTDGVHQILARMSETTLTNTTGGKASLIPSQISTGETVVTVRPDKNKNGISDINEALATTTIEYSDKKVFGNGVKMVEDAIPDTVKEATRSIKEVLGILRVDKNIAVREEKAENILKINELNEREIAAKISVSGSGVSTSTPTFTLKDHTERPLRYLYWGVLAIVAEILNRSWLFYVIVIGALYFSIRYIWRKVRGR